MTDLSEIATAFDKIIFLPGSFDKRFAKSISSSIRMGIELSENQTEWMYRIIYKYRRQCPDVYEKCKDNQYCSRKEKK